MAGKPTNIYNIIGFPLRVPTHIFSSPLHFSIIIGFHCMTFFNACGNMHWATDVDVRAISEALHVGFIIFTDFPQDSGSHIYSLHQTHANYDWWILLYWIDRVHYKLMEWTDANLRQGHSFFHCSNLAPVLLQTYNDANLSCPIGHISRSDVG